MAADPPKRRDLMPPTDPGSDILRYIVEHRVRPGENLPTIAELSQELGVSVAKIREELSVARALGLVQIKPRTGTEVQEFDFAPAATLSVLYALGLDPNHFQQFAAVRASVELTFWHEAVACLQAEDVAALREIVCRAQEKLNSAPAEMPFREHQALHLTFFKRLDNPFVQGLLHAYWAAYHAFGLAFYADLAYLRQVWDYHARMVECVARGDFDGGHRALKEHMGLLRQRPPQPSGQGSGERSVVISGFFE